MRGCAVVVVQGVLLNHGLRRVQLLFGVICTVVMPLDIL